jgi:hypothetical protein
MYSPVAKELLIKLLISRTVPDRLEELTPGPDQRWAATLLQALRKAMHNIYANVSQLVWTGLIRRRIEVRQARKHQPARDGSSTQRISRVRVFCFAWLSCLKYLLAGGLLAPAILHGAERNTPTGELIRFPGPEKLRFDNLVRVATIDPPPSELQARLQRVLQEPCISNEATLSGAKPKTPFVPGMGPMVPAGLSCD